LPTSNILARITGTTGNNPSLSTIYGTIRTAADFGSANLFLMNPAGFLFGPNATVNVGGMVAFTSADYLRLQDIGGGNAGIFHADPAQASVLTSAPVAAFGFLGSNPGLITVQGSQLSVSPGQSISLVGGNITVQSGVLDDGTTVQPAQLSAQGGQINLASVASPGEVLYPSLQTAPNVNGQSFTNMGTITLTEGSTLNVSANAAGTVRIRGGQLMIDNSLISADTGNANGAPVAIDINVTGDISISTVDNPVLTAMTTGSGDAGAIHIASTNMDVTAASLNNFFSLPIIDTHTSGSGKAGDVVITTANNLTAIGDDFGTLTILIDSGTVGPGHGGNVSITAKNIDMTQIGITTGKSPTLFKNVAGSAGNLTITADSLHMRTGPSAVNSFLLADASNPGGQGGDLTITAHDIRTSDFNEMSASGQNAGAIHINADQLIADSSRFTVSNGNGSSGGISISGRVVEFTNGNTVTSQAFGDQPGGNITITATDHLTLSDSLFSPDSGAFTRPSGLFTNSLGFGGHFGTGGAITVTTPNLQIIGGARIDSSSQTSGNAGPITITANNISISGEGPQRPFPEVAFNQGGLSSGIYSRTNGGQFCTGPCGNAAPISITTGSLSLTQGAQIDSSTASTGSGGNITINADQISIAGTRTDGTPGGILSRATGTAAGSGNGGIIELHAGQFQVTNGAQISASTLGPGNAGSVIIEGAASPAQSVLIDGAGSGIFTDTDGTGAGGNISINANSVTLQNGGTLSAATSGTDVSATGGTITVNANQVQLNNGGLISASTTGAGAGGSVTIGAGSTFASDASTVSSTAAQAQGGDITITAGQSVTLSNGSSISASSNGPGNAGNILINAGQNYTSTNSAVTTQAVQASGGNITVLATGTVQLTNSQLNASVQGSSTTVGGNITIDPQYVILLNSQILAQATQGQGGAISINITNGGLFLPDATSTVSASSQFGVDGIVTIQSPNAPAGGKIIPLSQKPLLATSLLNQRCASLAGGEFSSFTVAGRDSLPTEPGGWLASPMALSLGRTGDGTLAERGGRSGMDDDPARQTTILSLRQIAPAGFLTQSFAVEGSAGCQS
jgi:filamentous hemagglutinin family protein